MSIKPLKAALWFPKKKLQKVTPNFKLFYIGILGKVKKSKHKEKHLSKGVVGVISSSFRIIECYSLRYQGFKRTASKTENFTTFKR
jgi:hypothetical protein